MKKLTVIILILPFIVVLSNPSYASLIGDEVIVKYQDPFVVENYTVTVQDGVQDAVDFMLGGLTINLEADSVVVGFNSPTTFPDGFFSGIIIDDLNPSAPYISLADVSVDTNLSGWSSDRLMFYDDVVMFNWAGLFADENTEFTADLVFDTNPVPIPGTMLLFVTGLCSFTLLRKFKKRVNPSN